MNILRKFLNKSKDKQAIFLSGILKKGDTTIIIHDIGIKRYSIVIPCINAYNVYPEAMYISNGKISDCCNKKRKSAGGYQWSLNKYDDLGNYSCNSSSKPVYQYSLSGCYIKKYEHLIDAVKEMNLNHGEHISNCCNGNRDTAYGFMWSYEKHDKILPAKNIHNIGTEVIQYDLKGNYIKTWESIASASKELGLDASAITKCCKNKRNKCGNYSWQYDNEKTNGQDGYAGVMGVNITAFQIVIE